MQLGTKKRGIIIACASCAIILVIILGLFLVNLAVTRAKSGEIIFDESVSEAGKQLVLDNLPEDLELKADIVIAKKTSLTASDEENQLLYNILVPVTDFYNSETNISAENLDSVTLIPFNELNFTQKLLAIDGEYYLDTLNSGAKFEYLEFSGEDEELVRKVIDSVKPKLPEFPTHEEILTFAQTGVTALSRGMTRRLVQTNDAKAFAVNIGDFLSNFDLTHTSNEASFSANESSQNICADPRMMEVLTAIGLDIVELTGNHNQDCGDNDAIATIDKYRELGIKTVGGGKTAAEAAIPLEIEQKNTGITMLAYNYSTGGYTTDATPGANYYTPEKAEQDIATAKARGDFVIVDVQFYECNSYASTTEDTTCDRANSSAGDQIGFFRHLIDLSADIVVGTSAHQPQTFELYGDGVIYYGLGNLFFDQSQWPGTTRSLILVHYFYDGKLLQTRLTPTVYDNSYQTRLLDDAEARAFIERLASVKPE